MGDMMSTEPTSAAAVPYPLTAIERRLLGVLVEKAKTTPDVYPLSVNSLVTGSNQKSNRDPMLNLKEDEVEESLEELLKKGLVSRVTGSRVERWRHHLYEVWNVNKVEMAILAELLLRGAQTEGELRTRASRMEPIDDLDALRLVLKPMKERGLVVWLGEEGRRGSTLTHGFLSPRELEHVRAAPRPEPASEGVRDAATATPDKLAEVQAEVAAMREQMQQLQQALTMLTEQVKTLKESLGA
jgi:uncharacterized protein